MGNAGDGKRVETAEQDDDARAAAQDESTVRPSAGDDPFAPPVHGPRGPGPFARGAAVGRYVLLDRIGAGGMGHVFAAYDPELDRKVAVKLVVSGGLDDELRLLREAQALARLAHPNVVAIHDVGVQAGHVWIAMEFVVGETVGAWARASRRSWRAVLDVLLAAARGVAAVHAAGLVHRDLKPGNVMVGADGRVRVMDFGLVHGHHDDRPADDPLVAPSAAREDLADVALTRAGEVLGTPAYMAPEQWRGEPAAAPADQFGWSVMAWELLLGERPFAGESREELREAVLAGRRRAPPRGHAVPTWLRRVVERGLAGESRERWPGMAALVSALERGQSLVRRRVALALLLTLAAIVGIGLGLQRWQVAQQVAACEDAGREIDALWDEPARVRLREAFAATGLGYAAGTAERVLPWLGEWTTKWRVARTELCMRTDVHGTWDDDLRDRGLACLAERRFRLAALLAEFDRARGPTVQRAIAAVASLRGVDDCLDEDLLRRQPIAPAGSEAEIQDIRALLAQADSLELAGDPKAGLGVATRALERARSLAWPPLEAAAQASVGNLLRITGSAAAGKEADTAAYFMASSAGAWDVAASAALQRLAADALLQDIDDGRLWARLTEVANAQAGDPRGERETRRLGNLAFVETAAGAHVYARELRQRALALVGATYPEDHPRIALHLVNLANAELGLESFAAARTLLERALAIQERVLGVEHPELAITLNSLGAIAFNTGDLAAARDLFTRTRALLEKTHGPVHPLVANALGNLGNVMAASGDLAGARVQLEQVVALREQLVGPDDPELATNLANLSHVLRAQGDHAGARTVLLRALAIREKVTPESDTAATILYNLAIMHKDAGEYSAARELTTRALAIQEKTLGPDSPQFAESLANLGDLDLAEGRPSAALPRFERAVAILDATPGTQQGELSARAELARTLVRTGGDRARAVALARSARDGLRAEPARAAELAEIEAWLAEHDRPAK